MSDDDSKGGVRAQQCPILVHALTSKMFTSYCFQIGPKRSFTVTHSMIIFINLNTSLIIHCLSHPRSIQEIQNSSLPRNILKSSHSQDCSALLLVDDGGEGGGGGEVITQSECPFCHRLFCAQCYVPWHPGTVCAEFQRLNEDERGREDLLLRELAQSQKWGRCPQCKYYVERTEGCPHMTCRCKFQFCYGCGEAWNETHGGCQRN